MANQPSLIPSAWAANNSTTENIPATTTESGKASWDQGFPVETSLPLSEGGIPPKYGDFNGILNVLSQFCLFAQAGGQFTWSSTLSYSVGSIVVGSDGSIYRAVQATTNVNPVGDTSGKWERIVSKSDIDALETDIQTAMSDAANAVSNASAAQSAVSTLDANVVKLSGNQTVGGTKTFNNAILASGTTGMRRDVDNSEIRILGGTSFSNSSSLVLYGNTATGGNAGAFRVRSQDGTTNKDLIGKTEGTLTWDGKEFVYTSGDQDVGGIKSFTSTVRQKNLNYDVTVTPSTAQYNGVTFVDKNDAAFASITTYQNTNDNRGIMFRLRAKNETGVTSFLQGGKDASGVITLACYGTTRPSATNSINLGDATYRWKEVFANTGTINTSDERLKDNISAVPDAVLDAWGDVDWSQFQFKDAITEKGADKARLHNGLIAQRIDAVFKEHGLDASRYGLFCYDAWDAVPEEKDEDGNIVVPATEAGDAYSLRYEEALAMEAAYQRRRADRAEARISALERRLNEMEAVLASLISPVGDETYAEPEQEQDAEQEQEENG